MEVQNWFTFPSAEFFPHGRRAGDTAKGRGSLSISSEPGMGCGGSSGQGLGGRNEPGQKLCRSRLGPQGHFPYEEGQKAEVALGQATCLAHANERKLLRC